LSRNFEILRRAGLEDALFPPSGDDVPPSRGGALKREPRAVEPEAAKPEKRDLPFREFGDEPSLRGRRRRQPAQSEQAHEEVVKVVQRVFVLPNSSSTPRLVIFSNVDRGSGSSEICIGSGEILAAQVSGSVCLVDANFHTPALHRLLGVDKIPGLADATVSADPIKNFAVRIGDGNLWLVPAGSPLGAAQGPVASERLRSRMLELKEKFDYVLIDAPPVNSYADAALLGQLADGAILVVEANSTRRESARMAKQILQNSHVKLLGAILNNRTFPIPEALYRNL
jgi:Mrp family chromosome partitioning ATPase